MRDVLSFLRVLVSLVLRIDAQRAAAGVLTGQVEDVATGDTAAVRGIADLLAFCARHDTTDHLDPERENHV